MRGVHLGHRHAAANARRTSPIMCTAAAVAEPSCNIAKGSIVKVAVKGITSKGLDVQIHGTAVTASIPIAKFSKRRPAGVDKPPVDVGEIVPAVMTSATSGGVQLSLAALETQPGALYTSEKDSIFAEAEEWLQHCSQASESEQQHVQGLNLSAWRGRRLLQRFISGHTHDSSSGGGSRGDGVVASLARSLAASSHAPCRATPESALPHIFNIRPGCLVEGRVLGTSKQGVRVLVAEPGVEGLIALRDISYRWRSTDRLSAVFRTGMKVMVMVTLVDGFGKVPGVHPRLLLSTKVLEVEPGSVKLGDDLARYNSQAPEGHAAASVRRVSTRLLEVREALAMAEQVLAKRQAGMLQLPAGTLLTARVAAVLEHGVELMLPGGQCVHMPLSEVSAVRLRPAQLAELLPHGSRVLARLIDKEGEDGVRQVMLSIRVLEHYPGEVLQDMASIQEQARRMQLAEKRRREEAAVASITASLTLHTAHAAGAGRPKAAPAAPHPSLVTQTEPQPAQPGAVGNGTGATTQARQEKGARSCKARAAGGRPTSPRLLTIWGCQPPSEALAKAGQQLLNLPLSPLLALTQADPSPSPNPSSELSEAAASTPAPPSLLQSPKLRVAASQLCEQFLELAQAYEEASRQCLGSELPWAPPPLPPPTSAGTAQETEGVKEAVKPLTSAPDSFSGAAGLTSDQLQCAAQSRQVWLRARQVHRQVMAATLGLRIKSRMLSVAMLNTPESRTAALASAAQAAAADSLALGTAAEAWAWEGIKHTPETRVHASEVVSTCWSLAPLMAAVGDAFDLLRTGSPSPLPLITSLPSSQQQGDEQQQQVQQQAQQQQEEDKLFQQAQQLHLSVAGPLLMDWAVLPGGGSGADVLVSGLLPCLHRTAFLQRPEAQGFMTRMFSKLLNSLVPGGSSKSSLMVRVLEQSGRLPSPAMTAWAVRKTAETRKLFGSDNTLSGVQDGMPHPADAPEDNNKNDKPNSQDQRGDVESQTGSPSPPPTAAAAVMGREVVARPESKNQSSSGDVKSQTGSPTPPPTSAPVLAAVVAGREVVTRPASVSDSVLWLLGAEALLQLVQVHGVRPGFDWWSSLLQRLADHTPLHLWSSPGDGAVGEGVLTAGPGSGQGQGKGREEEEEEEEEVALLRHIRTLAASLAVEVL